MRYKSLPPSVWVGDKYRAEPPPKTPGWVVRLIDGLAIGWVLFMAMLIVAAAFATGTGVAFLGVVMMLGYAIEPWLRTLQLVLDDHVVRGFFVMNGGLAILLCVWGIARVSLA